MRYNSICLVASALVLGFTAQGRCTGQDKIAIIGAGIGGATAAYFLNEELGHTVRIDM